MSAAVGPSEQGDQVDAAQNDENRICVLIQDGRLHENADDTERALVASGAPIYSLGRALVTICRDNRGAQDGGRGVKRATGAPQTVRFTPVALQDIATRHVPFFRFNKRENDFVPTDCTHRLASAIIERGQWEHIPALTGFVEAPTLRRNGEPITEPGYDEETGIFLIDSGLGRVSLPGPGDGDEMLQELARTAAATIMQRFASLPFVDDGDRSAAVAGLMNSLFARSLTAIPLTGVTATAPGTGKSYYVDGIATIATGRPAAVVSQGRDTDEFEKRLSGALAEQDQIISIDNLSRFLEGDFVCQTVSQESVRIRLLGRSDMLTIPARVALFATGNNLVVKGDLNRRTMVVRLDAGVEHPESRHFERDLLKDLARDRRILVEAALTISRAYILAGEPDTGIDPYGGFRDWDRFVRRPLVWAGCVDPLTPAAGQRENDPELMDMRALLTAWREHYEDQAVTAAKVAEDSMASNSRSDGKAIDLEHPSLHDALAQILGSQITAKHLGYRLRHYRGRIVGGLRLEHAGTTGKNKTVAWKVVQS